MIPDCYLTIQSFRTNNRKWTENKFKAGEAKPELLDDWDQRLVVTTLWVDEEGTSISLEQVAEKDQVDTVVSNKAKYQQPFIC